MRPRVWSVVVVLGAVVGFVFAAVSTYDFVAHLDRQVHGVHCSFLPGITGTEAAGSDCQVTLMSPYSSVLREAVWGGIPVSLPAMSVFAFLAAGAVFLVVRGRQEDARATGFLLAATALPVLTSAVMAYIAFSTLGAACKLCIGIYAASGVAFAGALGLWLRARSAADRPVAVPWAALAGAFGVGVLFVGLPVATYAASAPDFSRYVGACGELQQPDDPHGVLVPLGAQGHGVAVVEVLDPLCPACRGFEERFAGLTAAEKTRRRALLFPLDDACNWMVDDAIHPGACAVSEAVLCAGDDAEEVLSWSFEHQERIREAAESDPEAAARMARERFPELADCIGSPTVQARLNLGLRWAVDNQLPVLTPQVYVGATRLCDEDTDLGMEYALSRLIERTPATPVPPPPERPEPGEAVARRGLPPAPDTAAPAAGQPATATHEPAAGEGTGDAPAEATPIDAQEGGAAQDGPGEPAPAATEAAAPAAPAPAAPAAPAPAAPEPPVEAPPAAEPPAPTGGDAPEVTQ